MAAVLREARRDHGLSQGELATLAGTSRPQVNRLESGRQDAGIDTWARVLAPLGVAVTTTATGPRHGVHDVRSRVMHAIIAERARDDPGVLARAHARVAEWQRSGAPMSNEWVEAWSELLAQPDDVVIERLADDTPEMRDLRQSSPFAGALSEAERRGVIRALPGDPGPGQGP